MGRREAEGGWVVRWRWMVRVVSGGRGEENDCWCGWPPARNGGGSSVRRRTGGRGPPRVVGSHTWCLCAHANETDRGWRLRPPQARGRPQTQSHADRCRGGRRGAMGGRGSRDRGGAVGAHACGRRKSIISSTRLLAGADWHRQGKLPMCKIDAIILFEALAGRVDECEPTCTRCLLPTSQPGHTQLVPATQREPC